MTYRIATLVYAAEWLLLVVLATTAVFWPSVRLGRIGPMLALILLFTLPLCLVVRRGRASGFAIESSFDRRSSLLQFVGMFLSSIGLLFSGLVIVVLLLSALGLAGLVAPLLLLCFPVSLCALAVGISLIEVLHALWLKRMRFNQAVKPA